MRAFVNGFPVSDINEILRYVEDPNYTVEWTGAKGDISYFTITPVTIIEAKFTMNKEEKKKEGEISDESISCV